MYHIDRMKKIDTLTTEDWVQGNGGKWLQVRNAYWSDLLQKYVIMVYNDDVKSEIMLVSDHPRTTARRFYK